MAYLELWTKPRIELSVLDEFKMALPLISLLAVAWIALWLFSRKK